MKTLLKENDIFQMVNIESTCETAEIRSKKQKVTAMDNIFVRDNL